MKRRQFTAALGVLPLAGTALAQGDDWPQRTVRIVCPFTPGGSQDNIARRLGTKLQDYLGQSFVIDNRTGAGGTIGTTAVAQSRPDGYTLLIQTAASHASNPHLYKKLPYDALNDFAAISPLAKLVAVLTVHPSLPTRSVKELITLAQKRPEEILFGHAGYGSFIHLNAVLMQSRTGIQVTQVPFKGGGPAVVGLVSGQTHAMIAGIGDIIEHIKAKRVRALAVTSLERVAQLPEIPRMADTVPGFECTTWVSIFAPAGTPRPLIDQLNAELGNSLRDPQVASRMSGVTYDPVHGTPEALTERVKADYAKIGELFRQFSVTVD